MAPKSRWPSTPIATLILERALNDIYGQIDGYIVDIDLTLQKMGQKEELIGGLKRQVETLRARVEVMVREKEKQAPIPKEWRDKYEALQKDNAVLKANQEQHDFFWLLGAGLSVFLAGCLAGFIGPKLLPLARLLG